MSMEKQYPGSAKTNLCEMCRVHAPLTYRRDRDEYICDGCWDTLTIAAYDPHEGETMTTHAEMLAALKNVQKIISEAAMTGFNCFDGDWAERLFQSQQVTSAAIKKGEADANDL